VEARLEKAGASVIFGRALTHRFAERLGEQRTRGGAPEEEGKGEAREVA
jgi:hypothetical protein